MPIGIPLFETPLQYVRHGKDSDGDFCVWVKVEGSTAWAVKTDAPGLSHVRAHVETFNFRTAFDGKDKSPGYWQAFGAVSVALHAYVARHGTVAQRAKLKNAARRMV